MKAIPVIEDKFWIVKDSSDINVGTIRVTDQGKYKFALKDTSYTFNTIEEITDGFGRAFFTQKKVATASSASWLVNGFPAAAVPFFSDVNTDTMLPIYYKTEKCTVPYCAGYYIIRFNSNWVKSFCPKLQTLQSNQYKGPYKDELEMKQELKSAKSA